MACSCVIITIGRPKKGNHFWFASMFYLSRPIIQDLYCYKCFTYKMLRGALAKLHPATNVA